MDKTFEEIISRIPGGIAVYQLGKTLKTLKYTDGIPMMLGFTREEYNAAVSIDAMDIVYESDRLLLKEVLEQTARNRERVNISYRVYCKDHSVLWVNLLAYPAEYGPGEPPVYYAFFTNVTSQFGFYQDVCDNSAAGLMVVDKTTAEVYYANKTFFDLAGKNCCSYWGMKAADIFDSDMTEQEKALLMQPNSEFVHKIARNGCVMHIHSRETQWMNRKSILLEVSNITEEYQRQEELQRRYEDQVNYSRMLSAASAASSMVNLTKNCITLQNTDNKGIMDIITKQTPQQGFEAMYPHIPDEKIRKEYAAVFDTETIIKDFDKGIAHKSMRHPYESMDCWLESSYDAVRNPKTGDLEIYCFARDVSQEEMQKSVANSLMTNEYEAVILINPKTGEPNILVNCGNSSVYSEQKTAKDHNKGLENYFLKNSADDNAKHDADAASLKTVKDALEKQKIYTISYSVYNKDQKIIRKRATYSYLNEYKTSILCTVQNITKDFQNEVEQREALKNALLQAHEAIKAKADFLSKMSHDMRTPMNAILGLSNLGMDLNTVEELKEYLLEINASGKQLLSLINDTLDVSRIENGKLTMNREYIMSSHLIMEAIAAAKVVAEQKGVKFELVQVGIKDTLLYVDAIKITKIFTNLLSNAIKFTAPGGTVTIKIERLYKKNMDVYCALTIKDTGIGMSPEFLQHIYEPFSQESTDYLTNASGTGLGMTIAKELADFLGCKMEIQSELNKGTEVCVIIPFKLADKQPEKEKTQEIEKASGTHKILVAEDHPLNAKIIKKLLENLGYIVVLTENGQECVSAFARAAQGEYAAILMDIRMPVMDGLEAAKTIRNLEKEDAKTVPIIAMTANAFEQDVKECLCAGMNAHLAKPIVPETLASQLRQAIGEKQQNN